MATQTPTTTTEPAAPAAPVDPGIIAGTAVLGFVALTGPRAEAAMRAAAPGRISWGTLVTLKLLLPAESSNVIISPWGNEVLERIVEQLMQEARGAGR